MTQSTKTALQRDELLNLLNSKSYSDSCELAKENGYELIYKLEDAVEVTSFFQKITATSEKPEVDDVITYSDNLITGEGLWY